MHTPPRFQWGNNFKFWHAGSHPRRNHPCHIFGQSVQGFWISDSQNSIISIGVASRSYNSVSTAVLRCDLQQMKLHNSGQ